MKDILYSMYKKRKTDKKFCSCGGWLTDNYDLACRRTETMMLLEKSSTTVYQVREHGTRNVVAMFKYSTQ